MSAPTTSLRSACKTRLLELLAVKFAGSDVKLDYAFNPREAKLEYVFLGGTRGPVSIRVLAPGRKQRDDTFTIVVHFMAGKPKQTAQEADDRVVEMYAELENVLADNAKLGDLAGVLWAAQNATEMEMAEPALNPDGGGYIGEIAAYVEVKTILR